MKDIPISKKVLWDNIQSWIEECKYYEDKKPKDIPIAELKILIEECPPMGADAAYLRNERIKAARRDGQKEVISRVRIALNDIETKEINR